MKPPYAVACRKCKQLFGAMTLDGFTLEPKIAKVIVLVHQRVKWVKCMTCKEER